MVRKKVILSASAIALFVIATIATYMLLRSSGSQSKAVRLPRLRFPHYPGAQRTMYGNGPTQKSQRGGILGWFDTLFGEDDVLEEFPVEEAGSLEEACTVFSTIVRENADKANFCRSDRDCTAQLHGSCALGCEFFSNRTVDITSLVSAAATYKENRCPECPKTCVEHAPHNIVCRDAVCVLIL